MTREAPRRAGAALSGQRMQARCCRRWGTCLFVQIWQQNVVWSNHFSTGIVQSFIYGLTSVRSGLWILSQSQREMIAYQKLLPNCLRGCQA